MRNDQFDRNFRMTEKTVKWTFGIVFMMWVIGAILSLALTGGIIYVAWHFISKYW